MNRVLIEKLKPDENNARRHGDRNIDMIKKSLETFGQQKPIVITKDLSVVAGNGTLQAAKELGWKDIGVIETELSGKKAVAYAIADNQTAALAEWDAPQLMATMQDLQEFDVDLANACGFDDDELSQVMKSAAGDADVEEDGEIPEPPKNPVTNIGDVWILGDHRRGCGDSTDESMVALVMDGSTASACITDPPYSVDYDRSQKQRGGSADVYSYVEHGNNPSELLAFMDLVPADVMVWSYPIDRHFAELSDAYRRYGWELRKELIWVKDMFSFWPGAKYQQIHEPIMLAARVAKPVGGNVPANATTVFHVDKPRAHDHQPTAKPIELWKSLVENHVDSGDIVFDPFCGSGTTLIVAEQLGRICRAIELAPVYCDVIVERWENLTGKKAKKA